MGGLRRIGRDIRNRRFIDAYAVAAVSVVLAVLSLVGDVVGDGLRWAVVLAALSLLTYHVTLPARVSDLDDVLHDRSSFEGTTFASRLRGAREVWIFGPSAINLLRAVDTADQLRKTVLAHAEGRLRVMVLDPEEEAAVALAARQLDESTDYPTEKMAAALPGSVERLEAMAGWTVAGTFEHRYAPYNPGFSLVAIDPDGKRGLLIVEFHGIHNESTGSRMHVELTRGGSERWFVYWRDQFEHLWDLARRPQPAGAP